MHCDTSICGSNLYYDGGRSMDMGRIAKPGRNGRLMNEENTKNKVKNTFMACCDRVNFD